MSDSWGRFWDRLVVDGVAVFVVGFVLQGLWFAGGSALTHWHPDLEPTLRNVSERFLALWVAGTGIALLWAVKRAWSAREA